MTGSDEEVNMNVDLVILEMNVCNNDCIDGNHSMPLKDPIVNLEGGTEDFRGGGIMHGHPNRRSTFLLISF
ncbi:hypothetical protein Hanom_Chr10g00941131 [Helianthus anomalus]